MTGMPAFTPATEQPFRSAARVIRQVMETEHQWFAQGDPHAPMNPWMPFQPAEFLSILFECIPELTGREFLDVGCGPGTKMLLARHFYGLRAEGIEVDRQMGQEATQQGVVFISDALKAPPGFYGLYDLIWLYRPFRDPELESQLELRIMGDMKGGAVLAGGAWEHCPAEHGWPPVVDDWELRRGAWLKPHPVVTLKV